ncbi:MAG TPA: TonB-dependent receptor, partial [Thermoanaerobaculia bacterium]|nr:TonB-dependent receptor [Thermoanaerobaculia bacterium]
VNDAYDAEHTIDAGYFMADATFGKWRFISGARYESSDQQVTTFNPFDTKSETRSINQSSDVLPSLNVVYQLSVQTNLRAAYGRSLNRPEFRELSPFSFVEVTGGRSVAGNPELKQATLDSFDLRWEHFPSAGEVIAASVFYKKIDKPIERIIQPTTELRTSFVNADSATLYGTELELRRSLTRLISLNANYAYIKSDVTVGARQLQIVTNLERPMEGQSDQVANVALQFFRPQSGTMVRLLGAYAGKRLTDVGADGLPDIYEAPHNTFDVVVSQDLASLARGLEVKLAASNLTDEVREFTQGGSIQRSYRPGRSVSFSLSYSPF